MRNIVAAPLLYFVFMKIRPFTRKNILLVVCACALIIYSIFSYAVIGRLKAETSRLIEAYAELIQLTVTPAMTTTQKYNIVQQLLGNITNPVILTDTAGEPVWWNNIYYKQSPARQKTPLSRTLTGEEHAFLINKTASLRRTFPPQPVYVYNNRQQRFGYLIYGNSILLRSLFIMPFLEIILGATFIALLYLAFHNIRITERSNLWVGLAKETAHQLGTPISSIMGWVEFMRSSIQSEDELIPGEALQILSNMDNDLRRLTKITSRFSQIGSIPSMVPCDLREVLTDVSSYFQLRLPLLLKRITIEYDFKQMPLIHANRDLLEWVFENLLKNAIDAITRADGSILIKTEHLHNDNIVRVQICDNGKGISWESQKQVFSPGFTTKRRGWGLGLTLAKRIIEDYHKGEIYIKWSQKEKGTTFNVDLPVSNHPGGKDVSPQKEIVPA